ncbi:MAG: hypothetical protein J7480_04355 [Microbacteriaceae bacterium]|nr:hypothetical protein [Microbacteriaceae bacterium]
MGEHGAGAPIEDWFSPGLRALSDPLTCPRCTWRAVQAGGVCGRCGADLRGEAGERAWAAGEALAAAVAEWRATVAGMPTFAPGTPAPIAEPWQQPGPGPASQPAPAWTAPLPPGLAATDPLAAAPPPYPAYQPAPLAPRPRRESAVSVQSLLAVAGAGLVAVAAIVFTFFNPDVRDTGSRFAIIGAVTALFLAGALLTRRLRLTAESLAALSVVFLALDAWFAGQFAPDDAAAWLVSGLVLLGGALLCLALAAWTRLRSWLLGGVLGLAIAPAVLAHSALDVWWDRVGFVAVGAAALGGHWLLDRLRARFGGLRLLPERVLLLAAQLWGAVWLVFSFRLIAYLGEDGGPLGAAGLFLALAVTTTIAARWIAGGFLSSLAGLFLLSAGLDAGLAIVRGSADGVLGGWWLVPPILGVAVAYVLGALVARPTAGLPRPFDGLRRSAFTITNAVLLLVGTAPVAAAGIFAALGDGLPWIWDEPAARTLHFAFAASLSVLALGLLAGRALLRPAAARLAGGFGAVAPWLLLLALLVLVAWPGFLRITQVLLALAFAALVAGGLLLVRRRGVLPGTLAVAGSTGAHALLADGLWRSWLGPRPPEWRWPRGFAEYSAAPLTAQPVTMATPTELLGLGVLAVLVLVAFTVPLAARWVHWGAGSAYALVLIGTALARIDGLRTNDVLALVATAGALAALVATFIRPLPRHPWYAILAVTTVPFLLAIVTVVAERTIWTFCAALLTGVLALVLAVTRRDGLAPWLRVAAAALVVPSFSTAIVSLVPQLQTPSGSPVALPVIAVLVAVVVAGAAWIERVLLAREVEAARGVVRALEASASVTGAIAVLLAFVLPAAGLGVALVVLLVLGLGSAASAVLGRRGWGWWLAGVEWTGALWCALWLAEVQAIEPFVLPPALAALTVGVVGVGRGRAGRLPLGLAVVGLGAALVTILAAQAFAPRNGDQVLLLGAGVSWRALLLLAASVLLVVLAVVLARAARRSPEGPPARFDQLSPVLLLGAIGAAFGATVQAVRWAAGIDGDGDVSPMVWLALGAALPGVVLAFLASRVLTGGRSPGAAWFAGRRWPAAPALLALVLPLWVRVEELWATIWVLWAVMLALLVVAVVTAVRLARGGTRLPPVWITVLAAWGTAVAAWSPRALRVEVFSVPVAAAVLVAGVLWLPWVLERVRRGSGDAGGGPDAPLHGHSTRGDSTRARSLDRWPAGSERSWWLLGPGLVLLLLPSVVSTGTDPVTWRAILVIALALAAILAGSIWKLAAPFWIGLGVLPIENIVVFASQIGHGVESLPWWITLVIAGIVLLAIAINAERRTAQGHRASRIGEMR